MKIILRKIRYLLEAVIAYIFYYSFSILSFDTASNLGSRLGVFIGPKLGVTKKARSNLKKSFPEYSDEKIEEIIIGMWDNLGRVLGEFPHIPKLRGDKFYERVIIKGVEYIVKAKNEGRGLILFSGHFANWEIAPKSAYEAGFPLFLVYRPPANMLVDSLIRSSRLHSNVGMSSKGVSGTREILRQIGNKASLGMLVDQKSNRGIPVKFFGRDAMTATGLAEFGLKYGMPLIPARVVRKNKTQFEVSVFPPLEIKNKSVLEIMTEVNNLFEGWIREIPEQWFWVHNRWPR